MPCRGQAGAITCALIGTTRLFDLTFAAWRYDIWVDPPTLRHVLRIPHSLNGPLFGGDSNIVLSWCFSSARIETIRQGVVPWCVLQLNLAASHKPLRTTHNGSSRSPLQSLPHPLGVCILYVVTGEGLPLT